MTDSSSTLTLGGAVSGAHMLSTAGNGVVKLSNAAGNSYSGGTSVGGASTLYLTNTSNTLQADQDIIVLSPTSPSTPIYRNTADWNPSVSRCPDRSRLTPWRNVTR